MITACICGPGAAAKGNHRATSRATLGQPVLLRVSHKRPALRALSAAYGHPQAATARASESDPRLEPICRADNDSKTTDWTITTGRAVSRRPCGTEASCTTRCPQPTKADKDDFWPDTRGHRPKLSYQKQNFSSAARPTQQCSCCSSLSTRTRSTHLTPRRPSGTHSRARSSARMIARPRKLLGLSSSS